jgi:hypothetical protein
MEETAAILVKANYTGNCFSGEKGTVEFYRNLPAHRYKLIVLGVHSSATSPSMTKTLATLFTSECYELRKYVNEQLVEQIMMVGYSKEDAEKGITYFGIRPSFVSKSMRGKFEQTTVIMMGHEGLTNPLMAISFIEKGAKVYIGWNASISASHIDTATTQLLKHLVNEKQTIEQAVEKTMQDVGPDPASKSVLEYYPLEARDRTIESKG